MILEYLSERKYFAYIAIALNLLLVVLAFFRVPWYVIFVAALLPISYLVFVGMAYNQYSLLNHKFYRDGEMDGYEKGKKEGYAEGFQVGHRSAIKDYYENQSEKQKQIEIIIRGIPSNKADECRDYLSQLLNIIKLPDTNIKQNNPNKTDELDFQCLTLMTINDLRSRINDEFPITISHYSTQIVDEYKAMDATGFGKIKVVVEGNATKGTLIVFDEDLTKTQIISDNYDKWKAEIVINVTKQIIEQGFIEGTATKDSLTKRITANIGV